MHLTPLVFRDAYQYCSCFFFRDAYQFCSCFLLVWCTILVQFYGNFNLTPTVCYIR